MTTPHIHYEKLPNGLVLLLRESHLAPVADFQVWAHVGSADEGPGEAGLAHFHEHMLFKGTDSRDVSEVAGAIEGVGGRVNAYTSFDVTVYHATAPIEGFGIARDVIVDMVRRSRFDPDEIGREIEVVLEEIRRSEDSPHHVCGNALFDAVYRVHPYRLPILGPPESVESFDRDKVRSFYERWYAPDNLTVVAVGDFDATEVAAEIRDAFADAKPAGARRSRAPEPRQTGLRSALLRRPFERACVEMAWHVGSLAADDTPHLDLLAFVLGEGESSRLVRRVKERDGVVDRVDASCYTPLDAGVFGVSADLEAENLPEALEAIAGEIAWLRREPVSGAELEKARTNFLASEHFERESVSGMARKLGSFELLAGDYRRDAVYLDAIRTATSDDLLRAAQKYLIDDALTVAAVLPDAAPEGLEDKAVARAVARGSERVARVLGAPVRRSSDRPEIHTYTLPSGATLHVEPRREVPVVALRGAFLGGLLAEDESNAGITQFLTSMWLRGTRAHSGADLARSIESIASDIDGFSGRSSLGLTLEVASESLAPGLELFSEVMLEPAFAPEEIEHERRDTLSALARREDRLGAKVFDLFAQAHWKQHPYRHPMLGTPETVGAFTREDLLGHHARLVRARNLVLAAAGDVDPDALAEQLSLRLAELDDADFEAPAPPEEPAPEEPRYAERRKDREQAHLLLGFRGLTVHDPDRFALEVIVQLLAGQGGRLFLELRDRRSLAYSVSAMNIEGLAPGFFALYIGCSPDKLDEAKASMLVELERLLDGPPPASELDRARRYLVGNFQIDRQRSAARAAQVALDARYGLGPDAAFAYADQIAAVTADDLVRVARRIIRLDAATTALIRP